MVFPRGNISRNSLKIYVCYLKSVEVKTALKLKAHREKKTQHSLALNIRNIDFSIFLRFPPQKAECGMWKLDARARTLRVSLLYFHLINIYFLCEKLFMLDAFPLFPPRGNLLCCVIACIINARVHIHIYFFRFLTNLLLKNKKLSEIYRKFL